MAFRDLGSARRSRPLGARFRDNRGGKSHLAGDAPILMLAAAATVFARDGRVNRWGAYDAGAASMSLCVQATESGLMVHQMGGLDPERLRLAFAIPETFNPMAMMAIGYG